MVGIDIAVLVVSSLGLIVTILFGAGPWWRQRKATRLLKPVRPLLDRGRHLLTALPETDERVQWVFDVEQWTQETTSALYLVSPNLCDAFNLIRDVASPESVIHRGFGLPLRLEGETRETYQRLQIRLENLRQIVTKPEDYLQ